ncbi:MAG: bis(5'-nucleosyl)-tetraphosphatase [bacterium]
MAAGKEVSAGAIVFRKENGEIKYLLLYKKAHGIYRAQWNFPRGWIEVGESEKETAGREIEEETGISDLKFIQGFREKIHFAYRREGKLVEKDVVYLLAETETAKVKLSFEHSGYGWLSFSRTIERLTFENDKEVLRKANDFLTKTSLDSFI